MSYLIHISILVCIFAILAQSLNLLAGYTGLLSLAQAAFFGIGAYAYALIAVHQSVPYPLALLGAVLLTALAGFLLSWPVVRFRDDYVVLLTFAFQVLMTSMMNNCYGLTGGPTGLPGIPPPRLHGWIAQSGLAHLILAGLTTIACFALLTVLVRSPLGRVLKAIREDEIWTRALGYNLNFYRISVFVLASGMAGLAGGLYAGYLSFIDPTSFAVVESVFVLSIVVVGGAGSVLGPFTGAALLVGLPEGLRLLGIPVAVAANLRQIAYGLLLVLMVMWRPRGVHGFYGFGNRRQMKG